jgi:hypothetical protein
MKNSIVAADLFYCSENDCILTRKEVYNGFLDYCKDQDNVEELEESTRKYNIETGNDVSMFEMFLLWEISSCNLEEVEEA